MSRVRTTGRRPIDLLLLVALVAVTVPALLLPGVHPALEWVLGVPFLLVVPGYALVSAQLGSSDDGLAGRATDETGLSTTPVVRVALAIPASIVVVATVAVVLSGTVGVGLPNAVWAIAGVTLVGAVVAGYRRRRRPRELRAAPLRTAWIGARRTFDGSTLYSLAMAVALVALVASIAFAGATGPDREAYTEFYVLTEDANGDLVANDFPASVAAGDAVPLHLAVENHEADQRSYDVVVRSVRNGSGTATTLDRFEIGVEAGQRAVVERSITPQTPGEDTRIEFLLYKGAAPADPDGSAADISLLLTVDVE